MPEYKQTKTGNYITVTQKSDPAYKLIADPDIHSEPIIYREGCYICEDGEFAALGMPLCRPCKKCTGGHVSADDSICDDCGEEQRT